jgi:hypothetical protein
MRIYKKTKILLVCLVIILFSACSTQNALVATNMPQPTIIPTQFLPSATNTPILTSTPTIRFTTIGSPFPKAWGAPLIWANDAFNGPFRLEATDTHHGHMDVSVPKGYSVSEGFDIDGHNGDVIAPVDGCITTYGSVKSKKDGIIPIGLQLVFPKNIFPENILEAFSFAGIENPTLEKISRISIDIGHIKNVITGCHKKGEPIAEIEPYNNTRGQTKVAFYLLINYDNVEYGFSPTLFTLDEKWECFPNSPYDCVPQPNDYAME